MTEHQLNNGSIIESLELQTQSTLSADYEDKVSSYTPSENEPEEADDSESFGTGGSLEEGSTVEVDFSLNIVPPVTWTEVTFFIYVLIVGTMIKIGVTDGKETELIYRYCGYFQDFYYLFFPFTVSLLLIFFIE
jgi:hypothetical protein